MRTLRQYVSYFLLLLFCRILAPEQALLALHRHEHTQHKHTGNVTHFSTKHTHCHGDNLFDAPFQPSAQHFTFAEPLTFSSPIFIYQPAWEFTFPNNVCLRGPPAIS